MTSHRRFRSKVRLNGHLCCLDSHARNFGTTEVDLGFGRVLVSQVPDVVPNPVKNVSKEYDRIPGTSHTLGGHSVRSLANLNSGPL